MNSPYKVLDVNFDNWADAQEYAWKLIYKDKIEYVSIFIWNDYRGEYGLLQELDIRRGVEPNPHFNTWTFAPYFWRQKINSSKQLSVYLEDQL